MSTARQKAIAQILNTATQKVGEKQIFELSAMRPPQFDGITAEEFYTKSIKQVKSLQTKYKDQINSNR